MSFVLNSPYAHSHSARPRRTGSGTPSTMPSTVAAGSPVPAPSDAAMAAGGLLGGLLFDLFGVESFARSALVLLVPVLVVVLAARVHGFPAGRGPAS
ncbi:hypothetical protein ACFYXP_00085 [Streptomyces sp. NPDC002466]|uniref:hypothetical protein n=1 Tax=unclassified Streptomyces TaxID=2593676 RepID=UPI0035D70E1F